MKKAIRYLLQNCCFEIGNNVFRQVIGIHVGSDATPFFVDLYLHYYKSRLNHRFVKEVRSSTCKEICYFFQLIDDVAAINNGGSKNLKKWC